MSKAPTGGPAAGGLDVDARARAGYQDYSVGERYEQARFTSPIGRFSLRREREAVQALLEHVEVGSTVLDCPCGTGRWWPLLETRGARIVAADVSAGMRDHARQRARDGGLSVEVVEADAACLPFDDDSFDWVFSFALTKHLSRPTQYTALAEFARVARRGVICSFGLVNHFTYEVWRQRHKRRLRAGTVEALPLLVEELDWMARCVGLRLIERRRTTTPIGIEYVCVFAARA